MLVSYILFFIATLFIILIIVGYFTQKKFTLQHKIWLLVVGIFVVVGGLFPFFSHFNRIHKDHSIVPIMEKLDQDLKVDFFKHFSAVKLPLRVQSNKIEFTDWPDIAPANIANFSFLNNLSNVKNFSDPILSSQEALKLFPDKVELKNPKYFTAFTTDNFVAILHIHKVYDDLGQRKTTYIILSTLTKQGKHIDSLKVGEATFYGNSFYGLNILQQKLISRFEITKDYQIVLKEKKTYRPYEGTTITTIWEKAGAYQIDQNGRISSIDVDKKIKRDE